MLVGGIVAVVIVLGVIVAAVVRTRSRDDVHSVEHYHRSLHTLEEMRAHLPVGDGDAANGTAHNGDAAYPASAFRVSGTSTVRLTEPGPPEVPPTPPPPIAATDPLRFDDSEPGGGDEPEPVGSSFMTGSEDRAMHGIDRRPRRLAAPAAAVGVVLVIVVVLIVAGMHTNAPHHGSSSTAHAGSSTVTQPHHAAGAHHPQTHASVTTVPPIVSAPTPTSAGAATYTVSAPNYSVVVAATNGDCWVQASNATTGAVIFSGTLYAGQSHALAVTGPLTVIAGAPSAFAATVDGALVALPPGFQSPYTLTFQPSGAGATA